jgi:ABC-type transport system involved in cytochrome bd biosynthesis fused ATPase/permease subunit
VQQQPTAAGSQVTAHDSVVVVEVQAGGAAVDDAAEVPGELELLKGINAFAEPGNLLALMGGSGAGKTTLMDVIAGRKTVGRITGDILVNGRPKQQSSWARQVGRTSSASQKMQCITGRSCSADVHPVCAITLACVT